MFARGVITNNLGLKVAALIVAIVIWLFAKGEEAANRHFSVPLVLRNIPEGVTTVERPPETVDVIFTGANKELLKLRLWGEPCAVIDMTGAAAGRVFRVGLSAANVIFPHGARVSVLEIVDPKSLDLEMDELVEKRLPVEPVVVGELAEGYYMLASPVSVPDEVSVFGPKRIVRGLEKVRTAALDLSGRRSRVEAARSIEFDGLWNLHAVPREVRVFVEVEGTAVVTLDEIPVDFKHEPGVGAVTIDPTTVRLQLSGPEHVATRLAQDDVEVIVDARGLPRGVHELVPEISLPPGVSVVGVQPMRFTVTLE